MPARKSKVARRKATVKPRNYSSSNPRRVRKPNANTGPKSRPRPKAKTTRKIEKGRVFLIAAMFIVSAAIIAGFIIYKKVDQNFASASSYTSFSENSDPYPSFSYIVVEDFESDPIKVVSISFVVLDRDAQKALIFDVPLSTPIDVPGRFATEEFSRVFALGGLNSEDRAGGGLHLTNTALFKLFGFKVDDHIMIESSLKDEFDGFIFRGKFPELSREVLVEGRESFDTSYSLKKFYDTYKFVNSLPTDRFIREAVTETHLHNVALFDETFIDMTLTSPVSVEKKNIAVLNGTSIPGVANWGGRVVRNLGGRVVASSNTGSVYKNSVLLVDDPNSETVRFLVHVFGINEVISKSSIRVITEPVVDRADIVLILGFDLATTL
jgi:hypothetical protein